MMQTIVLMRTEQGQTRNAKKTDHQELETWTVCFQTEAMESSVDRSNVNTRSSAWVLLIDPRSLVFTLSRGNGTILHPPRLRL